MIEQFEAMLAAGQDNALLRYTLGGAYRKQGLPEQAIVHLREAVRFDPEYSAAWKELGRALVDSGSFNDAVETFDTGVEVARKRGDIQAAKEMEVFRKRAIKSAGDQTT